jgi:hypothetical protein
MEQKLALPERLMVQKASRRIRTDMELMDESLHIVDPNKSIPQIRAAFTKSLDLRSQKHQTRLKTLKNLILKAGPSIIGNGLA